MNKTGPVKALLLISSECPHCEAMLRHCGQLIKEGAIAALEVINITEMPEQALAMEVSSVPWIRIGAYELEGARPLAELRDWCRKVENNDGMADYLKGLLLTGELEQVEAKVHDDPELMQVIIGLLGDSDPKLHLRVAIGALLETLQGTGIAHNIVHELGALIDQGDDRLRADAAHYLTLTESVEAIPYLEQCLQDPNPGVVEIAEEGLEELHEKLIVNRRLEL